MNMLKVKYTCLNLFCLLHYLGETLKYSCYGYTFLYGLKRKTTPLKHILSYERSDNNMGVDRLSEGGKMRQLPLLENEIFLF